MTTGKKFSCQNKDGSSQNDLIEAVLVDFPKRPLSCLFRKYSTLKFMSSPEVHEVDL